VGAGPLRTGAGGVSEVCGERISDGEGGWAWFRRAALSGRAGGPVRGGSPAGLRGGLGAFCSDVLSRSVGGCRPRPAAGDGPRCFIAGGGVGAV